jgi:multidrug efflux pump subunit AcrA (membrane-fusion protein)
MNKIRKKLKWDHLSLDAIIKLHDAPEVARFGARILVMFVMFITLMLILLPWQQTSNGSGKVIAFSPDKRLQNISAPFSGRIKTWYVREGQALKKGDPILEIVDMDPMLLERLKIELDAAKKQYEAADAVAKTSELDSVRQKQLFDKGISSRKDYENALIALKNAQSAEAGALAALTQAESRYMRQSNQVIRAPEDGLVLKLKAGAGTAVVSEGESIAEFVPEGGDLAVQIYIQGMDLPLVRPGAHVRLQFEGWPAIQFSGWPSVAVGTFGGVVNIVDPSANKEGKFRVIVVKDQENWPETRFIRQGTRVNAWILLNNVPLGFELWRQFNGFPPSLPSDEEAIGESE